MQDLFMNIFKIRSLCTFPQYIAAFELYDFEVIQFKGSLVHQTFRVFAINLLKS